MTFFLVLFGTLLQLITPWSLSLPQVYAQTHPIPIVNPSPGLTPNEQATISVFKKASRSVVYITNKAVRRDIWSLNTFEVPQGSGSGFIWDEGRGILSPIFMSYTEQTPFKWCWMINPPLTPKS